jgi:hypothetical protein
MKKKDIYYLKKKAAKFLKNNLSFWFSTNFMI